MLSAGAAEFVPSEHFKVVTYAGNSSTQSITVGFQPDIVWIKELDDGNENWNCYDSSRGVRRFMGLHDNAAEVLGSTNRLSSFDSTGFSIGSDNEINDSGANYVAYCWKVGGGSVANNTDGNATSSNQVNLDAGVSIMKLDDHSGSYTIGHGLGSEPDLVITKVYNGTTGDWHVYHTTNDSGKWLRLNTDGAVATASAGYEYHTVNSSLVGNLISNSELDYIHYAWKSIAGFSSFGTYTGNESSNGPIVEIGFEPALVIIKESSDTSYWSVWDNARNTSNPRTKFLKANTHDTETEDTNSYSVDFLSNGFQIKGDGSNINEDDHIYIYMAWAADADEEAPTLANSFNVETWAGTGNAKSIAGLGFRPDLVWIKSRSNATSHELNDSLRGQPSRLFADTTAAAATSANGFVSLDSNGFSLDGTGSGGEVNTSGRTYVGWAWKADDNEPTILPNSEESSLISLYKFKENVSDNHGSNHATASNVSYTSGKFATAADFNGSSSKILYPTAAPFNDSNTILAVSAWVKLGSAGDEFVIMSASSTSDQADYMMLVVGGNKAGRIFMTDAPSNANEYQANFGSSNDTNWNHYVWQLSASGGIQLWMNGTSQTRSETVQNGSLDETKWFGDLTYATDVQYATGINRVVTTGYSDGTISRLRLFNKELSSSSISSLYNEANEALVSVNANAGFSIVKYTGTGADMKVPHGLSAAPDMLIVKGLETTNDWSVLHKDGSNGDFLQLNGSSAQSGAGSIFGSTFTRPTATVFTVGNTGETGTADKQYIAYCFHSVTGYSKIGTYEGNGSARSITGLGFQPDFLIVKDADSSEQWYIFDSRRGHSKFLHPNLSNAEGTDATARLTAFGSDGFSLGTDGAVNGNGNTYVYAAFKKNVTSNTTLANSFKAVTWTGNDNNNRAITGVGFRPDLVWIKRRNSSESHAVYDSVRGPNYQLEADDTDQQALNSATYMGLPSFDSDGFSVGNNGGTNRDPNTYVGWCWKAGNTWQHNITGDINSTVNVNTANGFSIVKYHGNSASSATIGHGLSSAPQLIITKPLNFTAGWPTQYNDGSTTFYGLRLNETGANDTSNGNVFYANTAPTSSVYTVGGSDEVNDDYDYIAYCFHSVSGFCKIGTYTGTGTSSRSFTGVGFQPDFLMIKCTSATAGWHMYDHARGIKKRLKANDSGAEYDEATGGSAGVNSFDTDGWTIGNDTDLNGNNETFIYVAFKAN